MRIAQQIAGPTLPVVVIWWGIGCSSQDIVQEQSDASTETEEAEEEPETAEMEGPGQFDVEDTGQKHLIDFDKWAILDSASDPYPSHRTDAHSCDESGVLPEEDVLEINTNDCGYAVVGQPILHDIEAGDQLELLMYHSALSAVDQPAEAHFSFLIGDQVFWERTIDIPWSSEVYVIPIEVDWSAPAGTQARIHLHNHGGNSWRIAYLTRSR